MKRFIDLDNYIKSLGLDTEEAREENIGEIVTLEDLERLPIYSEEDIIENYRNNVIKKLDDIECPNCSMYCADAHICGFDKMREYAKEAIKKGEIENE